LKAKEEISKYIEEYLPAEYENCLDGLNDILKEAWTLSTDADSDKRERMQALNLAKECYAMKLDLRSSATVVDRTVKFVDRNRNRALTTEDKEARTDTNTTSITNEKSDSSNSSTILLLNLNQNIVLSFALLSL
jgi:hypothetical protein